MAASPARKTETVQPEGPAITASRPIDLVHLARQSLGDRGLEIELLGLFVRQSEQIMDRLGSQMSGSDRRWRHDLAHTLKGSARAIGAGRVAQAAESYEEALYAGLCGADMDACTAHLGAVVAEAQAAIADLLADA